MPRLIVDLDGVVHREGRVLPGVVAFFRAARGAGVPYVFLTNNSAVPGALLARYLTERGIPTRPDQVVTSADVAAGLLRQRAREGALRPGSVFIIGEQGLEQALSGAGFHVVRELSFPLQEVPAAVVVGLDRQVTYTRLWHAAAAVRAGAPFIGTNPDRTWPAATSLAPGCGALLAAVQAASGVAPEVVGKPAPAMFREAEARLPAGVEGPTYVIGDRLDTDIQGAMGAGLRGVLVLTGVTTRADLDQRDGQRPSGGMASPDLVAEDLGEVWRWLTGSPLAPDP